MIGRTVSHYRVTEKLGEGGMGVVYKALDLRLNRFVALKVLRPESVVSNERRDRLLREARSLSALNHPNILTVYDVDNAGGMDFIAMEYLPGRTLDRLIGPNGLPLPRALSYAVQIADGLSAAHAAGIVHRDLKPSNVMLTENDRLKILDFGLSKQHALAVAAESSTIPWQPPTASGVIVGTLPYMSPEQASGQTVDARSDIFSFGSILYEMLTGRRAFQAETAAATLAAVLRDEPPPADVPEVLGRIIARCLRKEPERRIQHIADLRLELADLQTEIGSRPSAGAWLYRNLGMLATVVAAVLIAITAASLIRERQRRTDSVLVPVPFTSYPGDEVQANFSPDGNQIVFVWQGGRGENSDLYVKMIGGTDKPLRLTSDPAPDLSPAWSPDGRFIAFMREQAGPPARSAVLLVPAIGGPERLLCEFDSTLAAPAGQTAGYRRIAPFPLLTWTPDAAALIVAGRNSATEPIALFAVSLQTGAKRRLTAAPEGWIGDGAPAVLPDGRSLLFSRATDLTTSELYRLRLATGWSPIGEPQPLTASKAWNATPAWLAESREILFSRGSWLIGPFSLWRMPDGGAEAPRRLAGTGVNSAWPAWSRDKRRLVFSTGNADQNIWRVTLRGNVAAGPPEKLIASTRAEAVPQYSPDGKRIAFTSDRSGSHQVWVADSDGSNAAQLTFLDTGMAGSPQWSPDSRRIVFDSNSEGQFDVFLIAAGGGSPRRLTTGPADDALPIFSPDGRSILFTSRRSGTWQIWKMTDEGGDAVQITRGGGRRSLLSADGKTLWFSRPRAGLWEVPAEGGVETQVLKSVGFLNIAATRNGLYFTPMCGGVSCPTIQYLSLATRSITVVAATGPAGSEGLSISPDGKSLLFAQHDQGGSDLMLVESFR